MKIIIFNLNEDDNIKPNEDDNIKLQTKMIILN